MARPRLDEFLKDNTLLALKLSSADMGGLIRKRFVIPPSTAALAVFADGAVSLIPEGQEVAGKFDLTIAKTPSFRIRLTVPDLRSSDGFALAASVALAVRIQTRQADMFKDFVRSLFTFPDTYSTGNLKSFIAPELKKRIAAFAAEQKVDALHKHHRFRDANEHLAPLLERFLFATGIRFLRLLEISFDSQEFEKAAAARAKCAAEESARREREKRREERLGKLGSIFKGQELRDVLEKIPDERMKGILYAKLMEDEAVDLTARDIVDRLSDCAEEVVEAVYRAMEGLLAGGPAIDSASVRADRAERIYAALGRKVLEIDPADPKEGIREHPFADPLRSVRIVTSNGRDILLAGSKRHVYLARMDDRKQVLEFPLPQGLSPRGGVNAIGLCREVLLATHSEYGLIRWQASKPGVPGERIHPDLTQEHRTTRGVQIAENRAYFASGPYVFALPVDGNGPPERYTSGSDAPVTALAVSGDRIFAGTDGGTIVCWKTGEPGPPRTLVRRKDGIQTLRLVRICSIPHLVYSARDLSVRARVVGQNLETAYESGGATVGVMDAASDYLCAADGNGRTVYLWRTTGPAGPEAEINALSYSEKPVLDIWIKRTPVRD